MEFLQTITPIIPMIVLIVLIAVSYTHLIYSVQSRAHQSEGYEYQTDAHL